MRRAKTWTSYSGRFSQTQLFLIRTAKRWNDDSLNTRHFTVILIRSDRPCKRLDGLNRVLYTERYPTQKEAIVGHKRALKAALDLERRLADGKRSHRSRGAWSRRLADRGQLLARTVTQAATRRTSPQ